MKYIALIATTNKSYIQKGNLYWGENYIPGLKKFIKFPEKNPEIQTGIIYFLKTNDKSQTDFDDKTIEITVNHIEINEKFISIRFNPLKTLEHSSELIRTILRKYLKMVFQIDSNEPLPYLAIIPEDEFQNFLQSELLNTNIDINIKKNNWKEVVRLFEPLKKLDQTQYWNNLKILNQLGFALTKLSECNINIKKDFKDKAELKKFLKEKSYYRKFAEKILLRCIELDVNNPSSYSSLAYFYYKNASELNQPLNRKDGNVFIEAKKFLNHIENAFELDYTRIKDHYRKGYLLTSIILPRIKYSKNKENLPENFQNPRSISEEGLNSYKRVVSIFESENLSDELKKRYFPDYLKTLYDLSDIYLENTSTKTEKIYRIYNLIYPDYAVDPDKINWEFKLKKLEKARHFMEKLIRWVKNKYINPDEEPDILKIIDYEDSLREEPKINTQLKAYKLGKIHYNTFLINNSKENLLMAKKVTLKSLQLKHKSSGKIDYIYNQLAQILLMEGKFEEAKKTILGISKTGKLNDYILIALLHIYLCMKNFQEAKRLLIKLKAKENSLFLNELEIWEKIIEKEGEYIDIKALI